MSTRNRKRAEKSVIEVLPPEVDNGPKTRNRRQKETDNVNTPRPKKNYVKYPSTDDDDKPPRSSRKNALKEANHPQDTLNDNHISDTEKNPVRVTRRTRKLNDDDVIVQSEQKPKRGQKKKKSIEPKEKENTPTSQTKRKKRGRKQKSNTFVEEEIKQTTDNNNTSVESFHSAAGSPHPKPKTPDCSLQGENSIEKPEVILQPKSPRQSKKSIQAKISIEKSEVVLELNNSKQSKKKDSLAAGSPEKIQSRKTPDKSKINNSVEKSKAKSSRLSIKSVNISNEIIENSKPETSEHTSVLNTTFETTTNLNTTFDATSPKDSKDDKRKSSANKSKTKENHDIVINLNATFDKSDKDESVINCTFDKSSSQDKSIAQNILNTTPLLIESSIESICTPESSKKVIPKEMLKTPTPTLKREGTFTKESPQEPSPGCTPYHSGTKSKRSRVLNKTHSVEKPSTRLSLIEPLRNTKVMFCSPINNPVNTQRKSKIIKSSMKGSNKSFLFEDNNASVRGSTRKRSLAEAIDQSRVKRKRLNDDIQESVNRLSKPRHSDAGVTPSKTSGTPSKCLRSKLPNFAVLHQKQFNKMESLDECQERKAKRAKKLLEPAKVDIYSAKKVNHNRSLAEPSKAGSPLKASTAVKPGYSRFGFKLNTDANPFNVNNLRKKSENKANEKKNGMIDKKNGLIDTSAILKRQNTLPLKLSQAAIVPKAISVRKEMAKQIVMREKPVKDRREENRTIIKGVRTNRRFELQMKSRNIN